MAHIEFFPFGLESIQAKFHCDKCDNEVTSEEISVPDPDFTAEKAKDSYNDNDGYAVCENCEKEFSISVWVSFVDGYIEIDDIDDEGLIEIIEQQEELDEHYEKQIDAIQSTTEFITVFDMEIDNLNNLNEKDLGDPALQNTLQRLIYAGVITCMEDYLSSTLINKVLGDDEVFKIFVRTCHGLKNQRFNLSELYLKLDKIRDIVKKELLDVIYHDLPKVKGMFEDTLGIEFPEIGEIMKIVQNRHDMIHRNGKNKEGEEIELNQKAVKDVIDEVEIFVNSIDILM